MIAPRSAANILLLIAGLVVWSSAFVSMYASLSFGCAFGWEEMPFGPVSLQRGLLILLWAAHLAMIAGLYVWIRARVRRTAEGYEPEGFFARTALWTTVVSLAVTIVNYAPILGLSTCL